jgi:hypothetical protein
MAQAISTGSAHVAHADRRQGPDARIDLGGADDEAAACADPDGADPIRVDEGLGAEEVHRGAEVLGEHETQKSTESCMNQLRGRANILSA